MIGMSIRVTARRPRLETLKCYSKRFKSSGGGGRSRSKARRVPIRSAPRNKSRAYFHMSMKSVQRSKGQSITASAAYGRGEPIRDERTGQTFNWSRTERVEHNGAVLPAGPSGTRKELSSKEVHATWNAVEQANKRKDARLAYTIDCELPKALNKAAKIEIAKQYATEIADRYGVFVDFSVHQGGEPTDPKHPDRNRKYRDVSMIDSGDKMHVHYRISASAFSHDGNMGKKVYSLDQSYCKKNRIPTSSEVLRPLWAKTVNQMLANYGFEDRIDHRSLKAQGIDRIAQVHIGYGIRKEENKKTNEAIEELNKAQYELAKIEMQERLSKISRTETQKLRERKIESKKPEKEKTLKEQYAELRQEVLTGGMTPIIGKRMERIIDQVENHFATHPLPTRATAEYLGYVAIGNRGPESGYINDRKLIRQAAAQVEKAPPKPTKDRSRDAEREW